MNATEHINATKIKLKHVKMVEQLYTISSEYTS